MKAGVEGHKPIFRGLGRGENTLIIGKTIQEIHPSGRCFLKVMKDGPARVTSIRHLLESARVGFQVLLEQSPSLSPFITPQKASG